MRKWQSYWLVGGLVAMALTASQGSFCADEKAAPKIDPKAAETLKGLADYFGGLKSVSVNASVNMNIEAPGTKQQIAVAYLIAAEKPNKLAMIEKESVMGITIVCDGKQVYTYFPMMKMYTVKEAPADLDAIWQQNQTGSEKLLFINTLLRNKPYESMTEGVAEAKYVGEETVDGVQTNHIKLVADFDSDVWIAAGEKPTLVKVVPDMMKALAKAGDVGEMRDMKMEVTITFKNWQLDTALPANTFTFEPPKDARKVSDFMGAMAEEEPSPILGKAAPDFKLDIMGGGALDLAALKGKSLIVLYFWATWPSPCEKATPVLLELIGEYKLKGVAFYAVNEQEDETKIREFNKKMNATYTVALDRDATAGEMYFVEGMPQTVVIGQDGTVQAVHVGYVPTLKEDLKKDLDQLLAGKKLVGEEQPKPETK